MRVSRPRFIGRLRPGGWWVIAPTAVIVALMLLMTGGTGTVTASPPRALLTNVLFQPQVPVCQSCHPKQYADWHGSPHSQATLDPIFHEQLAKAQNQAACLACHTTGFDTGSGQFLSEGVTCEACHGPYKEGHPAAATMQLPMASDTCRVCHADTFKQWESSKHAAANIQCFDCHMAHTQGLRMGSQEKLCAACHNDQTTDAMHAPHGIKGVDCEMCHMAQPVAMTEGSLGQKPVRDHSFKMASDVCIRCHPGTSSGTASTSTTPSDVSLQLVAQSKSAALQAPSAVASSATAGSSAAGSSAASAVEAPDVQKRVQTLRDLAVVSMGLAFAFGGFLGLVAGIIGMSLMRKRGAA